MSNTTYYITDSCAMTCSTCTAERLFGMANDPGIVGPNGDMSRRLAALIILAHRREAAGHEGSDEPFEFHMGAIQRTINARDLDTSGIEDEFRRLVDIDVYRQAESPRSGEHCEDCHVELEPAYMTCIRCRRDGWLGEDRDDRSDFVCIDGERHHFGSYVVMTDNDGAPLVLCGQCQAEPDESGVWTKLFELPVLVTLIEAWPVWMERNIDAVEDDEMKRSFGYFLAELRRAAIALSHVGELFPVAA
jgi:hypothetical protein